MTSAVISHARWATEQRLSLSILASALVHALAIIILASLLSELGSPLPLRGSVPPPIEVSIVAARPIPFSTPPEEPVLAAELPAPVELRAREAAPPPAPPIPANASIDPTETGALRGAETPMPEASSDGVSDTPVPPGDVAVGALDTSERLGTASSLRLAQRFPRPVSRLPRLRDSLVVAYPARAARAHREARIAALLIVDAEGRIVETTFFPNDPLFAATISEALRDIRLAPAAVESGPVTYWTILEFIFTMRPAPRVSEASSVPSR